MGITKTNYGELRLFYSNFILTILEKSCKIVDVADGAELVRIAADDSCLFQIGKCPDSSVGRAED